MVKVFQSVWVVLVTACAQDDGEALLQVSTLAEEPVPGSYLNPTSCRKDNWKCYMQRYAWDTSMKGKCDEAWANNRYCGWADWHYSVWSKKDRRKCHCGTIYHKCDWQSYLRRYPDLRQAFGWSDNEAEGHYFRHGHAEGRDCSPCIQASKEIAAMRKEEINGKGEWISFRC